MRGTASDRGAPERSAWLRAGLTLTLCPLGTPPRRIARSVIRGGGGGEASIRSLQISCTSHGASDFSRWRRSIRKNIIGHGMRHRTWHGTGHRSGHCVAARGEQSLTWTVFRNAWRPLALLDEPARKHSAGIFFDPLVKQSANLLAEIGGMSETRKFVALERVTRSREKEFPRRLCWGTGHVSLLERDGCKVIHQ